MGYLAIYRKYRPQTFDKVIGQEHVVKTLVNQIESGRIGHAYLFTGVRGTGKTSIAKIFAKAINCLNPVNGSPCGKCASCLALAEQSSVDVLEIDAASNNGVNEIRDLREKVQYPPVDCKYKVYIIDEVHMLSPSAFNALLKTLEEPPAHAVFILATTEVHKMPATILSRCMRFDFRLVDIDLIAKHVASIYDDLGKKYDEDAVYLIAKSGEGCVRDALSVADTCLSLSDGKLSYKDVLTAIGASDREKLLTYVKAVLNGDASTTLTVVDEILKSGKSVALMIKDVTAILRELLIVKTCKNAQAILRLPIEMANELKAVSDGVTAERILRVTEIYGELENDLKYSNHQRILFETASVKACRPQEDYDFDALLARIAELEKLVKSGKVAARQEVRQAPIQAPVQRPAVAPAKIKLSESGLTAEKAHGKILLGLKNNNYTMLWAITKDAVFRLDGNKLIIFADKEGDEIVIGTPENISTIKAQLPYEFEVEARPSPRAKLEDEVISDTENAKRIFGDDIVIVEN